MGSFERTCKDSDIGFTDTPGVIVSFISIFLSRWTKMRQLNLMGILPWVLLIFFLEIKELAEIVSSVFDHHQISSRFDLFGFSRWIMTVSRERKEKEIQISQSLFFFFDHFYQCLVLSSSFRTVFRIRYIRIIEFNKKNFRSYPKTTLEYV